MSRFTRFGSLALMVFAAATAVVIAKERPHSFKGAGQFTSQVDFIGSGTATHLGAYAEVGSITDLQPTGEPGVFLVTAWAAFTAADGDVLCETISGELNFITGVGTATITYDGGSGRFANATGTAQLHLQLGTNGSFTYDGKGVLDF